MNKIIIVKSSPRLQNLHKTLKFKLLYIQNLLLQLFKPKFLLNILNILKLSSNNYSEMQPTSNNQQPTTFKYFITSFKYFSKLNFSTSAPGQETLLTLVLKNLYDWNISPVLCLFLFPLAVPSSNISCMDASCFHSHDYHQMPEIDDSPSLSTILTNTLSKPFYYLYHTLDMVKWYWYLWYDTVYD